VLHEYDERLGKILYGMGLYNGPGYVPIGSGFLRYKARSPNKYIHHILATYLKINILALPNRADNSSIG